MLQEQLIKSCKKHDRKAQLELYQQYCEGMNYVALRYLKNSFDAEEAVQEAFIKAFKKLDQFNGEVSFGAWLKKIVINKCIDFLKSKKLELVALNEHILKTTDEEEEWMVDDETTVLRVKQEIDRLPEKYKYVVMLFLIEGYDHQEISQILKITEVASRTLLHRGKQKLQDQLKLVQNGTGY